MKKLLITLALLFGTLTAANAQFGIIGGWTMAKSPSTVGDLLPKNANLFHAGVAYKFDLGPFFTLQPALVYQGKATYVDKNSTLYSRSNFLELELGAQVGIDLLALRPFFLFEPFIGVDLGALNKINGEVSQVLNEAKNKFEGGFGVGGGIELVNHIQISVQWFMNFGKLYNGNKLNNTDWSRFANLNNYQGVKITLGLFF
jgi:hypothetical protein